MKTVFYFAQVEKEKKKGMMDINLRYVAAVRGPHFPRPLVEHSYQSYLKYIEEK